MACLVPFVTARVAREFRSIRCGWDGPPRLKTRYGRDRPPRQPVPVSAPAPDGSSRRQVAVSPARFLRLGEEVAKSRDNKPCRGAFPEGASSRQILQALGHVV